MQAPGLRYELISISTHFNPGQVDTARFLIEKGSEIDVKSNDGWTPLSFAAYYGDLRVPTKNIRNSNL